MKRSAVGESGLALSECDWYTMGADASPTLEPIEHKQPRIGRGIPGHYPGRWRAPSAVQVARATNAAGITLPGEMGQYSDHHMCVIKGSVLDAFRKRYA